MVVASLPQARAQLHLHHGGSYSSREAAIAAALSSLPENQTSVVILEGLPAGQDLLQPGPHLHIHRIAPGCFCCIGNISLRVTLNRTLRQKPAHIFLAIATDEHLDKLKASLQEAPYTELLEIVTSL